MDNNYILSEIASKAGYIADVANDILFGKMAGMESIGIVDAAKLAEISQHLENIADALDEYNED